eukprot:3372738-Prymnesium_polylepis.2
MCNHDAADETWVLDWMAGMLTNPETKPAQALAVVGPQGSGKGLFAKLVERVVGPEKVVHTTSTLKSLFKQAEFETKILIHITEGTRFEGAAFKSLVSDQTISIRVPKRDPIVAPSYHRVLITSNAPVSGELRRIRQVVHERVEDEAHYRAVAAALDDNSAIQQLRVYLLCR